MRRAPFALATALTLVAALPAEAQWFGPAGGFRPCFGFCRPREEAWGRPAVVFLPRRPFWAGPGGFGPARFGPGGFGGWGRPFWWRREARIRRFLAWRRWAMMGEARADAAAARPLRIRPWRVGWRLEPRFPAIEEARQPSELVAAEARLRPAWRGRALPAPTRASAAMGPVAAIRQPPRLAPPTVAPRVLMANALTARPRATRTAPVVRAVLQPVVSSLPHARPLARQPAPDASTLPVALTSEPAAAAKALASPAPAPRAPAADVPVAPLD